MNVSIQNPKRISCQTLLVEYSFWPHNYVAYVDFESDSGGTLTMQFNDPEDLRQQAAALNLLAESLEEKQASLK